MKDGGPAFPLDVANTPTSRAYEGMSLRDWFAGQALAGMLASPPIASREQSNVNHQAWAANAYAFADAMIQEREKHE